MTSRICHLSSTEIVERYLAFFQARDHMLLPGSPLVTPDNSTSFIIAGMQPLQPYLRAVEEPPSHQLTSLQRCLRSDDADMARFSGEGSVAADASRQLWPASIALIKSIRTFCRSFFSIFPPFRHYA